MGRIGLGIFKRWLGVRISRRLGIVTEFVSFIPISISVLMELIDDSERYFLRQIAHDAIRSANNLLRLPRLLSVSPRYTNDDRLVRRDESLRWNEFGGQQNLAGFIFVRLEGFVVDDAALCLVT